MRKKEYVEGAADGVLRGPQPPPCPYYRIEVPGLRLPRLNEIKRWNRWKQADEVKRVRELVWTHAVKDGVLIREPLAKARVTITAWGPYQRRDSDGTYFKDVLDAIVARWQTDRDTGVRYQRWGAIVDDNPKCIGKARLAVRMASVHSVVIVIEGRGRGRKGVEASG